MNSLPLPAPHGEPRTSANSHTATRRIVSTLQEQAAAHEQIRRSDARVARALAQHAAEMTYTWQTADDREAELRVYFQSGEEVEVLAAQLTRIDLRSPTPLERARYEEEFDAELALADALSLDLTSRIWGRIRG